jgi:hypothetical protein
MLETMWAAATSVRRVFASLVAAPALAALALLLHWLWGAQTNATPVLVGFGGAIGAWLSLCAAARLAPMAGAAERVRGFWERADVAVAAVVLTGAFFHLPESAAEAALAAVILAAAAALLWLVRLAPSSAGIAIGLTALLLGVVVPKTFAAVIIARIAETHDLTVDHRLKPNGRKINSDGLRFAGEADVLADSDFVVLFLGDSYTYGWKLRHEDSYPYVFERLLGRYVCEAPIRAVNMGWTSSSPLLGLRLLREVGFKYRPDLVVYNLDMSDFHDDLDYAIQLRRGGDLEPDWGALLDRLLGTRLPGWRFPPEVVAAARRLRRDAAAPALGVDAGELPDERFFALEHPLEQTRDAIERGTMRVLRELNRFTGDVLGASLVLVVYPRPHQYSVREAPVHWESDEYETLGPYSREPFRYFAEVSEQLPYPVIDLLPDFEATDEFPLFFAADPHWNRQGARFVAERVAAELVQRGLVPCRAGAPRNAGRVDRND